MNLFSKKSTMLLPLILVLSILLVCVVLAFYIGRNPGVSAFYAYSGDNCIELKWESTGARRKDVIELTIISDNEQMVVELPSHFTGYTFTNGEHAQRYHFSLMLKSAQTPRGDTCSVSAMFLDHAALPDLPIVQIETVNQSELPFTIVTAPAGCWGMSVVDNEYVAAEISISTKEMTAKTMSGQIRVRGNTSAVPEKKSYKMKLDQAADLLGLGNDYADKEWVLLPFAYQLQTTAGLKVSELCGFEWEPQNIPVNVIINGDWKGCYHLSESVKVANHRVDISSKGFLIENDAYWWKETGTYFKTTYQREELAYTFVYPEGQPIPDRIADPICTYITAYERALLEKQGNYTDYIDLDSFAGWLLAHDILGTWDSGGSNMFLYRYDMQDSSKLYMGPLWDFSSVFLQVDNWARIHNSSSLHFDVLLHEEAFAACYKEKWLAISDTVADEMSRYLKDYTEKYGMALEQSRALDIARYDVSTIGVPTVAEATDAACEWFENRTAWLNMYIY